MDTFTIGGDLEVHRLGFGAMRITGEGIWGPPDDPEEAKRLLRRVPELGIDLIDTADSYGPEVSENLIAEALHPYPDGLVIATKGGLRRTGPGQWPRDARPERLKECCEASLRRLRLDRIDLYQLHSPDPQVPYEDSVGALKELQDEGKIRHVGRLERLARGARAGARDRRGRDRAEPLQPHRPPLGGRARGVRGGGDRVHPLVPARHWAARRAGRRRSTRSPSAHDATPAQIALAWLLARSPVMLPIPGTSSVEHLEENVAATEIQLSPEEVEEIGSASQG